MLVLLQAAYSSFLAAVDAATIFSTDIVACTALFPHCFSTATTIVLV